MNRLSWQRLLVFLTLIAAVIVFAGCKDEDDGTMYTDEAPDLSAPVKSVEAPAKTDAAPKADVAVSEANPANDLMKASADSLAKLPDAAKEEMASMGHSFPAPPKDRPHLPADVATVQTVVTGVEMTVPKAWKETPKEELSTMRLAQFAIPAAEGAKSGAEAIVFNFGPSQGGSVMANIERWLQQVTPDEDTHPELFQHETNGLKVTEVYTRGTVLPSTMGSGPKEPQADSALYGIIVEGAEAGNVFLKITGDRITIDAAKPAIATLVDSVKLVAKK